MGLWSYMVYDHTTITNHYMVYVMYSYHYSLLTITNRYEPSPLCLVIYPQTELGSVLERLDSTARAQQQELSPLARPRFERRELGIYVYLW